MVIDITSVVVIAIVSAVLAIVFDWFPGIAAWFNGLAEGIKKLIMTGLLVVICAVLFALG